MLACNQIILFHKVLVICQMVFSTRHQPAITQVISVQVCGGSVNWACGRLELDLKMGLRAFLWHIRHFVEEDQTLNRTKATVLVVMEKQ